MWYMYTRKSSRDYELRKKDPVQVPKGQWRNAPETDDWAEAEGQVVIHVVWGWDSGKLNFLQLE